MNNLPGFSSLRLLPFGALGRWRRALSQTLNTQAVGQNPVSAILSTYQLVRSRLMKKMLMAMMRRRSNLRFLEKRPIEVHTTAAAGHARLPVTMRHYPKTHAQKRTSIDYFPLMLTTSNVWTSFHAQRAYATLSDRFEKTKVVKRPKQLMDRPLVPTLVFEKPKSEANEGMANEEPVVSESKMGQVLKFLRENVKPSGKEEKPVKLPTPSLPIMHILDKKDPLAKTQTAHNPSSGSRPLQPNVLPKPEWMNFNVRSQTVAPKYPVLQKFSTPEMAFLKATNTASKYLETYETRLRALRQSQPLKLKVPAAMQGEGLTLPPSTHRKKNLNNRSSFKPRLQSSQGSDAHAANVTSMPSIKAHKRSKLHRSKRTKKSKYPVMLMQELDDEQRQQKTGGHKERDDLNNLLGDLLNQSPSKQQVEAIEFNKTAPLFKLVTTSMEGRSKLHTRAFEKQLETPQLYRGPPLRQRSQSGVNRRAIILGQKAEVRAKSILENKLSLLLKADKQYQDDDDDEEDNEDNN